ncbi:MAG: tetratricopeptide repeat protein [Chitinophagaceae bacterium]|nr:tetratricopeptide repeat protein [Chitinophagaceae bacterium]
MCRIEKLKEYLSASPADSFLQHALALEYIKLGNDTIARNLFEEILAREPGYIGSYYHLGRLMERNGNTEAAVKVYERGMEEARKAGDGHAYGELKAAWEELDPLSP